jgi:hypothetical protein
LGLLALPHWLYFQGREVAPFWVFVWFAAMAAAGWAWVRAVDSLTGAGESPRPAPLWKTAALAGALLALNWRAFDLVVPSRGDESFHILKLWAWLVFLRAQVSQWPAVAAAVVAAAAGLWLQRYGGRRRLGAVLLGAAGGLWVWSVVATSYRADASWLPRYPGFQMWWHLSALLYAPIKSWAAQEALYRVTPFVAVVILAVYILREPLAHSAAWIQMAAAAAVATAPTVRYYGTLLYLDLPLAVAATVVCFEIERVAAARGDGRVPAGAGWCALLLAGFLKETALLFLVVTLLFCLSGGLVQRMKLAWAILCPLGLFLLSAGVQRDPPYVFRAENIVAFSNYRILAGALWEQYGLLLGLAAAGAMLVARQRRWKLLGFGVAVTAAYTLLYVGDGALIAQGGVERPRFLGNARYMLAWLPGVTVFAIEAVRQAPRSVGGLAAAAVLAANLWWYPVSTVAAPVANWGDALSDTSDHFYPYDEAFRRGQAEFRAAQRVAVVGQDFFYPHLFYQRRWNWPARVDPLVLRPGYGEGEYRRVVELAARSRPDLIWVHVMPHLPLSVYQREIAGYTQAGEHRSRFHRILVYRKAAEKEPGAAVLNSR